MDPGNWITSIGGGAEYGYLLLSDLDFQFDRYAAAIHGSQARDRDPDGPCATRKHTSKGLGFVLWIVTELAIMATDIAEVIGGAIASIYYSAYLY